MARTGLWNTHTDRVTLYALPPFHMRGHNNHLFRKEQFIRLTVCLCVFFPFWFWERDVGFDCISSLRVGKKRNPSETDSIKSQIPSKTSSGKKDSTKDVIKDTTSDSQVNSCFPYRWPPASLTSNIYFYLFLY